MDGTGSWRAWLRRSGGAPARGDTLRERLRDARSGRVVFLSHCLLNEHTRYPGGACRACCVREVVERCLDAELGMVQLPCPEELAWGGVGKRALLPVYGLRHRAPGLYLLRRLLIPVFLRYSRHRYRRLARRVAAQIADYRAAGCAVVGVVGVDGSPSCGVRRTLAVGRAVEGLADLRPGTETRERANAIIRDAAVPGEGPFVAALRAELARRRIAVPFLAHDLLGELAGEPSGVWLGEAGR